MKCTTGTILMAYSVPTIAHHPMASNYLVMFGEIFSLVSPTDDMRVCDVGMKKNCLSVC